LDTTVVKQGRSFGIPETLLCAGTSAFLVALPHLHPEFSFVSLFALVPFFWQVSRVGFIQSLLLGALFGATYYLLTARITPAESPGTVLFCMTSVIVLFAVYSAAVSRIAKHVGINAGFFAILWLPVEHILECSSHLGGILLPSALSSSLLVRISFVFGVLMISFLAVLINALILMITLHLGRLLRSGARVSNCVKGFERSFMFLNEDSSPEYASCGVAIRAPPHG
jgi:apolipoprotein N-acyltransferase